MYGRGIRRHRESELTEKDIIASSEKHSNTVSILQYIYSHRHVYLDNVSFIPSNILKGNISRTMDNPETSKWGRCWNSNKNMYIYFWGGGGGVQGSVHRKYIPFDLFHQDAILHSSLISGKLLYMFRAAFHPSSGAYTTVFTVSGTCWTVTDKNKLLVKCI